MNLDNEFIIFIKTFKAYHGLTGAAAPASLCIGPALINWERVSGIRGMATSG